MFKVPEKHRIVAGLAKTLKDSGNNGSFVIRYRGINFLIVASDTAGWEHISVSIASGRTPTWKDMNYFKDMFWGESVYVMQFHVPPIDFKNYSKHCLHLWRPISVKFPVPFVSQEDTPKKWETKDDKTVRREHIKADPDA